MGLRLMLWVRLMFKGKSSASIPDLYVMYSSNVCFHYFISCFLYSTVAVGGAEEYFTQEVSVNTANSIISLVKSPQMKVDHPCFPTWTFAWIQVQSALISSIQT